MRPRSAPAVRFPSTAAYPLCPHHTDPSTAAHTPMTPVHRHLELRVPLLIAPPKPPRHLKYARHTVHRLTFNPENCPNRETTSHTLFNSCGLALPSKKMMRSSAYIMTVSTGPRSCSGKITKDATRENSAGESGSPWRVPALGWWYTPGTYPFPTEYRYGARKRCRIRRIYKNGMHIRPRAADTIS